jgi:hypothetical protein
VLRPLAAVPLVVLLGAAAPLAAQTPARDGWPTLAGSGLVTLPTAETQRKGHVALALNLDNRDRDPLGIDVFDGAGTFTVGLAPRAEAYGAVVFSRVVALPEVPALPPPPLDFVVPPGGTLVEPPLYALHSPTPYVDKRGRARFDEWQEGDALAGLKLRLAEGAGARPALALAAEVKVPLSRALDDLRSGSGTGGVDLRLRALAQWSPGPHTLVATAAYTRTGGGALGDRVIRVDAGQGVQVTERPLGLADRLLLGLGARRRLGGSLAAVVEASLEKEVGGRTPTLDAAAPLDLLGGVQARHGGLRLVAALRYHGHALPSGERRASPVGGLVDVTDVDEAALAAFLARVGAAPALGALRPGTHRIVATRAGGDAALPAGARVLAADYAIRSEHQLGLVFTLGWSF